MWSLRSALLATGRSLLARPNQPSLSLLQTMIAAASLRLSRGISNGAVEQSDGEQGIIARLSKCFPGAKAIDVVDISGGCGSMYKVHIEASEFQGMRTLQQHRLVKEALKEQIKDMHGLTITTKTIT